jgi:hypothetical protein
MRCIDAYPGYFSQTMDNNIKMEATSTRRAGLERFTFPKGAGTPYFVLDLAMDLPSSFAGGEMTIDPTLGRITMGGLWGSRLVELRNLRYDVELSTQFRTGAIQLSSLCLL